MKVGFRVGRRDGVELTDSKKISDCTEIEYVTEGLLLAQLRGSPNRIKNYDVVIVDEAHERNIETDLLLLFLRNHLRRLKVGTENFGVRSNSLYLTTQYLFAVFIYRPILSPGTFRSK